MIIRAASQSDLVACEEIFRLPELVTPGGINLPAEYLANYLADGYFLVAEDDGGLVGAIFGEPLKGSGVIVWELAVREAYRGRGIGSQLMDVIETSARKNGCRWIILYAAAQNEQTVKFYAKRGYDKGTLNYECAKTL